MPNDKLDGCYFCSDSEVTFADEKCAKCPALTHVNRDENTCVLSDIQTVRSEAVKIQLGRLNKRKTESCLNNESICSGNFIGPFKNKDKNLFFFSFDRVSEFNYEYFEFWNFADNLRGSVVVLFNELFSENTQKEHVVRNTKILSILGRDISKVKIVTDNYNESGVIVEYTGGSDCYDDPNLKYKSSIFFSCSKENEELAPTVHGKENCAYYFKWPTKYACSQCLKTKLEKFTTKCVNAQAFLLFEDSNNCAIYEDDAKMSLSEADKSALMSSEDEHVLRMFGLKKEGERTVEVAENSSDELLYVTSYAESIFCIFADNFEDKFWWIIVSIPVVVLAFFLVCCIYRCKYNRLVNNYQKLREENNSKSGVQANA